MPLLIASKGDISLKCNESIQFYVFSLNSSAEYLLLI